MKSIHLDRNPGLNILYTLPFGSHIYGSTHDYSDQDVISIVKESTGDFVLRYFDNTETTYLDHSYVGLNEFIRGLANYSNIEFFEALHTEQGQKFMEANNLNLSRYYNSRQAKAYLGMAARDLKYPDRRRHCLRCIFIAERIINKLLFVPKLTPTKLNDLLDFYDFGMIDDKVDSYIGELRNGLTYE